MKGNTSSAMIVNNSISTSYDISVKSSGSYFYVSSGLAIHSNYKILINSLLILQNISILSSNSTVSMYYGLLDSINSFNGSVDTSFNSTVKYDAIINSGIFGIAKLEGKSAN